MMADSGATRVDLHVKILDEGIVRRAKAAGLDVLVYAPHFTHVATVRERAARYSDDDLLVVPAREYFTGQWNDRRHVLAVDPAEPLPDFLTLDATTAELDRQDATVLAPHPEFLTMSLSRTDVDTYSHLFDAVEVYCPKNLPHHTRRMRAIAGETDVTPYASSYAHLPGTVGEVWVEYDADVETADDLRAAIESGSPTLHRTAGPGHALSRAAEFSHLSYENSWKKFRRTVLGGHEETNPYHERYDDSFVEDCSY